MLRIDSQVLRIILICISLIGLILFVMPMLVHIVNIGNMFGLGCSAVLLLFTVLNRPISVFLGKLWQNSAGKVLLVTAASLFILGVLYCLVMSCCMVYAAHKKPQTTPKAVIVLGCKVHGTTPSLMLSKRIRAAYKVLEADPDMIAVVSGGKGDDEDISEAQCMRQELIRMGIAESRIISEDRSTTTSENLRFSKEILAEHGITGDLYLATDSYHEMRAQVLARIEELPDCWPVSAKTSWYLVPTYWVREWFGLAHAFVFGN
ncbi:MAG: YdcF family protein [Oscillospiraceae bacterium]|nr:YdcF family protein [Oscillospiraceae bacterium]